MKPDNLLIDQHGHLKLTDFGLSRIGLLGHQTRENQAGRPHARYNSRSRPPSMDSAYLSSPLVYPEVNAGGSYFNQRTNLVSRIGTSPHLPPTDDVSDSGSESLSGLFARRNKANESPLQSFVMELANDLRSHSNMVGSTPPGEQKFVGTPDYLAPEAILGLHGDDAAVDWVCIRSSITFGCSLIIPFSGLSVLSRMNSSTVSLPSTQKRQKRCLRTFSRDRSNGMTTGSSTVQRHATSCSV